MVTSVGGPGSWNALCDVCGFKYKAKDLIRRWDGMMVCPKDWESRHPQDFLRVGPDQPPLPFTRPDGDGTDISPDYTNGFCSITGLLGQADYGEADCARADMYNDTYLP